MAQPPFAVQRAGSPGRLPLLERVTRVARRETYAGRAALVPEIVHLGRVRYTRAAAELPEHAHPRCTEICYVVRGTLDWQVADRVLTVAPGQVFFTHPGEYHGGLGSVMQPCELYFVQVQHRLGSRPAALLRRLRGLPVRCFAVPREVGTGFERMIAECRRHDAFSPGALRAALEVVLTDVLRAAPAEGVEGVDVRRRLSPAIARVLEHLRSHPEGAPSVGDLAAVAELGRSQLCRRFHEELGSPVHAFVLAHRLRAVRRALETTEASITAVAHTFNFSSSQYLATAFGRHFGITPAACRAASAPSCGRVHVQTRAKT